MSYRHLKEKEQALCAEIADLIEKANRCDQDEDKAYKDKPAMKSRKIWNSNKTDWLKLKRPKRPLSNVKNSLTPVKPLRIKNK